MNIRNTAADMAAPGSPDPYLVLAVGMSHGQDGINELIQNQERAGQTQLVASSMLPTKAHGGTDADFEAVGFTFGQPVPGDDLFRPATLPEGWSKQGGDHDMWSYVVDALDRRRVSVFYKAAFYDRRAHMRLTTVYEYLHECLFHHLAPVTDDTWATPAALAAAIGRIADEHTEMIQRHGGSDDPYWTGRIKELAAEVELAQSWLPAAGDEPSAPATEG